jgi:hypothetical protein
MKTYYSLLLAIASAGLAHGAATAYTTPVGYETLTLPVGTTYVGVRLHEASVVAGTVDTISSGQMTDAAVDFDSAMPGAGVNYIVEFENASGVLQVVTGADATNSTLVLHENVTAFVAPGDTYRIRKASTIATLFGATNSAGLAPGFGGPTNADLIQVPDGAGGLDQYFFDGDESAWYKVAPSPILVGDGSTVPIIYTDAFLVVINDTTKSLVVSGEVKKKSSNNALSAGTNYVGSVYPAGATLASAFGNASALAAIDPGFGGPTNADLIQILDGPNFNQYYYDGDESSWFKVAPTPILVGDGSTIPLPSGFIIANEGSAVNLLNTPPSAYNTL